MTCFVMTEGSSNSVYRPAFSLTLTDLCCLLHSELKKADSLSKNTSLVKRSCQTLRQEGTSIRRYKSKTPILDVTFLLMWHFSLKELRDEWAYKKNEGHTKAHSCLFHVLAHQNFQKLLSTIWLCSFGTEI